MILNLAAVVVGGVLEKLFPTPAHDWDVPVQDVEDECWEAVSPDGYYGYAEPNLYPEPAESTPSAAAGAVETGPPGSPASALSFADYVVPAITDVLAEHQFHLVLDQCDCGEYMDDYDWREHVAEFLAERIETCLLNRFPK